MNKDHMQQIFENYIEKFEGFNNEDRKEPSEYYKWEIVSWFKNAMDKALDGDPEEFAQHLKQIKKNTHDFIDNASTWPLYGLEKIAEQDGEAVKKMFRDLYAEDYGNLDVRQEKIETFLEESHQLSEKHNLADQYKNTFNSVTAYLFSYDPENNYVYKPNAAKQFAKYTDFGDDFGSGNHVKLKNYYRMCNELVDEIKKYTRLEELDNIRLELLMKHPEGSKNIYKDENKHVLAYDIIYCAYKYGLFKGITLTDLTVQEQKEQKLLLEKQQEAKVFLEKLKSAQEKRNTLNAAMNELGKWFAVGESITYKSFGKGASVHSGVITKKSDETITVNFEDGTTKTICTIVSVVNGYVHPKGVDNDTFASTLEILKNKSKIETELSTAEREFAPYSEYL